MFGALTDILNKGGSVFCGTAFDMLLQSSVLIVVLLAVDLLIRNHVKAVFRYGLWMLLLVKLVLPPALCLPTGIGYWLDWDLPTLEDGPLPVQAAIGEGLSPKGTEHASSRVIRPEESQDRETAMKPAGPSSRITWQGVFFLIWITGLSIFILLIARRLCFVKHLISRSRPAEGEAAAALFRCKSRVGLDREVELRLSSDMMSPAVCGLLKPKIVMPASVHEKLSRKKLEVVLIHELSHIKRGDLWVNMAQTFLQIIYFYNPLLWLVNAHVRRVREQAVDEMVLTRLEGEVRCYSSTLIDLADMTFARSPLNLGLVGVVESKSKLMERIRIMLHRPVPKSSNIGFAGITAVIALAIVLLPMAGAKTERQKEEPSLINVPLEDTLENVKAQLPAEVQPLAAPEDEKEKATYEREEKFTETLPIGAGLRVVNDDGSIQVRRAASDACQITATIKAKAETEKQARAMADKIGIRVKHLEDDQLLVETERPEALRDKNVWIHYEISVPQGRSLKLEMVDGNIAIYDHSGTIDIELVDGNVACSKTSGDIKIEMKDGHVAMKETVFSDLCKIEMEDGNLSFHEITGNIKVEMKDGDVSVHKAVFSSNCKIEKLDGNIAFSDITGNFKIEMKDGHVAVCNATYDGTSKVEKHDGNLSFKDINGNVVVEMHDGNALVDCARTKAKPFHVKVEVNEGAIELNCPPDLSAQVKAKVREGKIETNLPLEVRKKEEGQEMEGAVGSGKGDIKLEVEEGSITITK